MADVLQGGRIEVPVEIAMERFERQVRRDLPKAGAKAGALAADGILDAAARRFRTRRADLREAFARGLIDRREFKRRGAEAADAFNKELLTGIESLAKSGRLRHKDFLRLSDSLKDEGIEAGRALSDGFEEGSRGVEGTLGKLGTAVKAFLGLFIVREAVQGFRRLVGFLRGTASDAETLAKSYLQLEATAKLFNIEQRQLLDLATRARTEFKLTATASNEIATQVAKLAAISGEAERAQTLLNAALDLGASQGLDAAATAEALQQALRGLDEGTDKLLQKNPMQVYSDFATEIGRSAGSLTNLEQKQAIFNAVLEAGARVQGEYQRFLETSVGAQTEWRNQLQTIRELIGARVIPVTNRLMLALSPALADAARTVTGLLERMLPPAERLAFAFERLGVSAGNALPLLLEQRLQDTRDELGQLESQLLAVRQSFRERDVPRTARDRGVAPEGLLGAAAPEGVARLNAELARVRAEISDAVEAGDTDRIERLTREAEQLDQILTIEREILEAREAIRQTEAALSGERQKQSLRADLADIEKDIALLDAQALEAGESVGTAALRRHLEAKKRGIEVALGLVEESTEEDPAAPDPDALERAKKLAQQREEIEKGLADRIFAITHDLAEQTIRDIDRIGEAYVKAGGNIEDIAAQLEELKEDVRVGAALSDFRDELERLGRLDPTPAVVSGLESLRDRLIAARNELEVGSRQWQEYDAEISKVFATLESIRPDALLADVQGAFDRRMLELRELLARGLIDEEQFKEQGEKAAAAFHAAVLAYIKKLRDSGELSEELYQALIAALPKVASPTQDAVRDAQALARQIDQAARGALQLADAFGLISSEAAATLEQVIQVAVAVMELSKLLEAGAGFGAMLGPLGAIAGGIAALVSSFSGGGMTDAERAALEREQKERLRRLQENTDAIRELTDQLLGNVTPSEREALLEWGRSFLEGEPGGAKPRPGSIIPAEMMSEEGLVRVRRLEEITGLQILTVEGDIDVDAFAQAWELLSDMDLGVFAEDLDGRLDALNWLFSVLGDSLGGAEEAVRRFLDVIAEFSPAVAAELERILEEEGAEAASAWLRSWAEVLATEGITPEMEAIFGSDLTAEEIKRIIDEGIGWIEGITAGAGGVVGGPEQTRLAVNITQAQGNQLISLDMTRNRYLAQMVALLGGGLSIPTVPGEIPPPSPSDLGLVAMQSGPGDVGPFTFGDINVEIPIQTTGTVDPGTLEEAGRRAGQAFSEELKRELGNRHRGQGGHGSPKVLTVGSTR